MAPHRPYIQGSKLPKIFWRNGPRYLRMLDSEQDKFGLKNQGMETTYTHWHCPQCPEQDATHNATDLVFSN